MKTIRTRQEMMDLRTKLGVRMDWHEPDEQDVMCRVTAGKFDNAGFDDEKHVVLTQGAETYRINLATLLAWAAGDVS